MPRVEVLSEVQGRDHEVVLSEYGVHAPSRVRIPPSPLESPGNSLRLKCRCSQPRGTGLRRPTGTRRQSVLSPALSHLDGVEVMCSG